MEALFADVGQFSVRSIYICLGKFLDSLWENTGAEALFVDVGHFSVRSIYR